VAYRCRELSTGTNRWADAIPADFPLSALDAKLKELPSLGVPEAISNKLPNVRPYLSVLDPTTRPEPATLRLGDARAAVLTAHGAARLFSPALLGGAASLDQRLTQALGSLGAAPDRATTLSALRGLEATLDDGQAFAQDPQDTGTDKLPLVLEQVGGEPVVRASGDTNVHRGDRIAAVDGTPFATWYQAQVPVLSASTEPFRLQRAFDLLVQRSSAVLSLVDPSGTTRDVTVAAQPDAVFQATRKGALRASGILSGTNIYYLDADGLRLDTADTLTTLSQAAMSADGLILDLRGSPTVSPYDLAKVLLTANFSSPDFRIPVWEGQEGLTYTDSQTSFNPKRQPFNKKVVLLVGPSTVGPAEVALATIHDAVQADSPVRVKTVGRQTAGTAGNQSVLRLPGGFTFGFTGMEMRHADRTALASPGFTPDVVAEPTQADLAAGTDTELDAALTTLSAM
jgi:C-terminal processing protease CtpA/Prc